jgi:hypothetical protein
VNEIGSDSDVIIVEISSDSEIGSDSDSDVIMVEIDYYSDSDGDSGVDADYDEFFRDGYVIHSDSGMIKVGTSSDPDSDIDSEHNEDMDELPSAHDYEVADNPDEPSLCVSQKSEKRDMHKEVEKRDVVDTPTSRESTTTRRLWRRRSTRSLRRGTASAAPASAAPASHTTLDSPLL